MTKLAPKLRAEMRVKIHSGTGRIISGASGGWNGLVVWFLLFGQRHA